MTADFDRLTERQMACLRLQCEGLTHAQVGLMLGISKHTVRQHVRTAYMALYGKSAARSASAPLTCYLLGQRDAEVTA